MFAQRSPFRRFWHRHGGQPLVELDVSKRDSTCRDSGFSVHFPVLDLKNDVQSQRKAL